MKITVILGSRNKNGLTGMVVKSIRQGIAEIGGISELVILPVENIRNCLQCNSDGWGICQNENRCIIDDDFSELTNKVISSDAVIFATPVYFESISESLRAFLDRLRRIYYNDRNKNNIYMKPAIGICVAGGGGGAASCCAQLDVILQNAGFRILDLMPVQREDIELKKEFLFMLGKKLAESDI